MKNNYSVITSNIIMAQFDFSYPKENSSFDITIHDKISINEVSEKAIEFSVCRYISYDETEIKMVNVVFSAVVNNEKKESVESIVKKIREGQIIFDSVYAKISTAIADITSSSVFGPLVTIPMCDRKKVEIVKSWNARFYTPWQLHKKIV